MSTLLRGATNRLERCERVAQLVGKYGADDAARLLETDRDQVLALASQAELYASATARTGAHAPASRGSSEPHLRQTVATLQQRLERLERKAASAPTAAPREPTPTERELRRTIARQQQTLERLSRESKRPAPSSSASGRPAVTTRALRPASEDVEGRRRIDAAFASARPARPEVRTEGTRQIFGLASSTNGTKSAGATRASVAAERAADELQARRAIDQAFGARRGTGGVKCSGTRQTFEIRPPRESR